MRSLDPPLARAPSVFLCWSESDIPGPTICRPVHPVLPIAASEVKLTVKQRRP
jgi:hypothetical protein